MATRHHRPVELLSRLDTPPFWIGAGLLAAALLVSATWAGAPRAAVPTARGSGSQRDQPIQLSKAFKGRLPVTELTEEEAALHALNRLGYGPRPSDVDRVRQTGLEKWILQQLHPETTDDSALAARLALYPTPAMSSATLLAEYPRPEMAAKRMSISLEDYRKQLAEMARQQGANGGLGMRGVEDRRPQRVLDELAMAKMTRAIYSERQLNEQLVDFWFNHFNVFAYKDADRWLLTSYERDVIRPQ